MMMDRLYRFGCVLIFSVLLFVGLTLRGFAKDVDVDFDDNLVEQTIKDFSVSGINDSAKTRWDMHGDTARIKDNLLEVDNVKVTGFSDGVRVDVVSDKGYYNRDKGVVLLSKDVEAVSSTGARLVTDTAVWDTKKNTLETDDRVTITQDDKGAVLKGKGGHVELDKNIAVIRSDVEAQMYRASAKDMGLPVKDRDEDGKQRHKTIIRCKGPLEVRYRDKIAVFNNDVVVEDEEAKIYADKLTVYFDNEDNRISKIIGEGNVRIVKGDNITESEKAIYDVENESLTMVGEPKVLFYSGEEIGSASFKDRKFN